MAPALSLLLLLPFLAPDSEAPAWPQWGGPDRNFKVTSPPLVTEWGESGPPRIWERELGDGYSAIVAADGMLFTLYRKNLTEDREYVIALDAATGETVWEHAIVAPLPEDPDPSGWGGFGPNSTPLLVGSRLFTVSSKGIIQGFEAKTGELSWQVDAAEDLGIPFGESGGFSPSPLAYDGTIIIPTGYGGRRARSPAGVCDALFALDQESGEVVWASGSFETHFASPILVRHQERDQLVLATPQGIFGVDPGTGESLWTNGTSGSIVTPVWDGFDLLFFSSGGSDATGLVIALAEEGAPPEVLWERNRRVKFWQPTPVQIDGLLYGSDDEALVCVDLVTGEIPWKVTGYPVATIVAADDKLIILDQDGWLTVGSPGAEGFEVHGRSKILEHYAYTVPTLVGSTLFARDRKRIVALGLGVSGD